MTEDSELKGVGDELVFEEMFIPEPEGPRVEIHLPNGDETRHVGYGILDEVGEVIALIPRDGDRKGVEFIELIERRAEMIVKNPDYPDEIQGPEIPFDSGEVLEEQ
jgi:hypothetical protein